MRFPRQTLKSPSINMTPMLDGVFLLLLFFAVSATFRHGSQLALVLPDAQGVPVERVDSAIDVAISAEGRYSVEGHILASNDISGLRAALAALDQPSAKTRLVISADARATHQAVVNVMDVAGQLGFVKVNILTVQPKEEVNGSH